MHVNYCYANAIININIKIDGPPSNTDTKQIWMKIKMTKKIVIIGLTVIPYLILLLLL